MTQELDDFERKVHLLLENITSREREKSLSLENQQLQQQIQQLEKKLNLATPPSPKEGKSANPKIFAKWDSYVVAAGFVMALGYGTYKSVHSIAAGFHYHKAIDLYYDDSFKEAIDELTQVIDNDPEHVDAYVLRGSAFELTKKYDLAFKDLNKAISFDPHNRCALQFRGFAHYSLGNMDNAISDLSEALEPSTYSSNFNCNFSGTEKIRSYKKRGQCFFRQGKYEQAIKDYTSAIDVTKRYSSDFLLPDRYKFYRPELYHLRGEAWEKKGDLKQSRDDEKRAKELGYHEPEGSSGE